MYVYKWITLLLKLIHHCKSTILQSTLKTGINPDIYQDSGQYITKPFILPPCQSVQNPSSYSLITFIYQDLSRFQTMHYKAFHLYSHASLSKTPLHINCSLFCRNCFPVAFSMKDISGLSQLVYATVLFSEV